MSTTTTTNREQIKNDLLEGIMMQQEKNLMSREIDFLFRLIDILKADIDTQRKLNLIMKAHGYSQKVITSLEQCVRFSHSDILEDENASISDPIEESESEPQQPQPAAAMEEEMQGQGGGGV